MHLKPEIENKEYVKEEKQLFFFKFLPSCDTNFAKPFPQRYWVMKSGNWSHSVVNIILKFEIRSVYNVKMIVNNGDLTEWGAIWSEIIRVISKSNERAARVWFEVTNMIPDQNCTTRNSITN